MANPTLLDIAIANAADPVVGLIEESIKAHPEISRLAARTIPGLNYRTVVRTAVPTVGFRAANEGSATVKSTYENRLVECFILNPTWNCDKAVADAHVDGAPAFIAMEALGIMEGAMRALAGQFYYGTLTTTSPGGDLKGFPGLIQQLDTTNMVVDAGGTTDDVASSVWAVRSGPQDLQFVWGSNGSLAMSDVIEQQVYDGSNNPYKAYVQDLLARPGLQFGRSFAAGRIKKITTDSGKGLTDALLAQLLAKFPVGYPPDYFLMTRRSLQQLRASRTATNPTGAPAPFPTEAFGIPIELTDAIADTEKLAL